MTFERFVAGTQAVCRLAFPDEKVFPRLVFGHAEGDEDVGRNVLVAVSLFVKHEHVPHT